MISEKELVNNIDDLISDLKNCINDAGITGDSSEFQIITELFLFKFLNDKFKYKVKKIDERFANADSFDEQFSKLNEKEIKLLYLKLGGDTAVIQPNQTIGYLFNHQNDDFKNSNFADFFDKTLAAISANNSSVFGVKLSSKGNITSRIDLFDGVCKFIIDPNKRVTFAKSVISHLANSYNFECVFEEKYDFFSTIFEHLISDYNNNGGGNYAEYYTPRTIAQIIAKILIDEPTKNATVYDPTAGSGTLLMATAHEIGEDRCVIFSQDLTQKSVKLLRLNLILNGLTHSLNNVHQGNILNEPACRDSNGNLSQFDYIVSNPPFKVNYSDQYNDCVNDKFTKRENGEIISRYFAGVPSIPAADHTKAPIYLLVLQHIIFSMNTQAKAGIVVPTKFLDWTSKIAQNIRKYLIDNRFLKAIVTMPSNVFANTGTNVSVIFIDKKNKHDNVLLYDASSLGEQISIKVGGKKIKKTILSDNDISLIINTINNKNIIKNQSVLESCDDIEKKAYSLVPGQYFNIDIDYEKLTKEELENRLRDYDKNLNALFDESHILENKILASTKKVTYNE